MTIQLGVVAAKHERRIRLIFSQQLAAAAFTSTSYYSVQYLATNGSPPNVVAVFPVTGSNQIAELQLDGDLVGNALYQVTCTAVPAQDATTFTGSQPFQLGAPIQTVPQTEPSVDDIDDLVFGVDLVWTGLDYLETPAGDMATLSGLPNAQSAIGRRLGARNLPWLPTGAYGPALYSFVDGPASSLPPARSTIQQQALRDDRVTNATATLVLDDPNPDAFFNVVITLIGNRKVPPFPVALRVQ